MKIKIGHLYPYELTLYGENGNLKALKYALEQKDIEVEITSINKEDNFDIKAYDFVYIGSGRPEFLEEIKERLEPYKKDIKDYINKDKVLLATGNSIAILELLRLYEIEYYDKRKVYDIEGTTSLCNGKIYGFQNTEYLIKTTKNILFSLEKGYGNNETCMEGYKKNNFYATSIIGPILARNDNLTSYLVDTLIKNKKEEE